MDAHPRPLFLPPALPSDLLHFIIDRCSYPTTLIVCSNRAEFLAHLTQDTKQQQQKQQQQANTSTSSGGTTHAGAHPASPTIIKHPLAAAPLSQVAVTRHIRTVFVPTVTHLRAFLSVFSSPHDDATSKVSPPPAAAAAAAAAAHAAHPAGNTTTGGAPPPPKQPLLIVYDLVALHRDTSEWSVQGLGSSVAALVEAGRRAGLGVVVVEGMSCREGEAELSRGLCGLLGEKVPVLSGSERKVARLLGARGGGGNGEGSGSVSGWAERTVGVGRVLGRWFEFRGDWNWGPEG